MRRSVGKSPCEKPLVQQLEIMEKETRVHSQYPVKEKARREGTCLKMFSRRCSAPPPGRKHAGRNV